MPSIQVLDQNTINQIAAGEVIERPASVVKELTENAMDAGATAVTVEIREGGISMIRITDNGCGIHPEDVRLAFLPHATSKIRRAEDLANISSLGFRGEALASVAAVARVELITKTKNSLTGIRFRIEGGEEQGLEEIGAPDGTTFVIRDLFYNTPARKNFLKTAATEGAAISSLMERLALSHPEVSFRLIVNQQSRLHTSGNHRLKDIIYTIYGRETAGSLLPIEHSSGEMKIRGFAGRPEINRGNRSSENYFVNGRYVKSPLITRAIENAYRGFVMQQKYPFVVFHLSIPSGLLDVNVHPNKMELRFRNEEEVYQMVYDAVRSALTGEELIPRRALSNPEPAARPPYILRERGPEPFEKGRLGRQDAWKREPSTIEQIQKAQKNALLGNQQVRSQREDPLKKAIDAMQEALSGPNLPGEGSPAVDRQPDAAGETVGMGQSAAEKTDQEASAGKTSAPGASGGEKTDRELSAGETSDPEKSAEERSGLKASAAANERPESGNLPPEKTAAISETAVPAEEKKPQARQMELFEDRLLTREARSQYRLIGQLFDTYWLIQYKDRLLIMDQHAAHEKVLFEKNVKAFRDRAFTSQQVQPPVILTCTASQEQALAEHSDLFKEYGFQIESFGGRDYAVYAVPGNLPGLEAKEFLTGLLDSLSDESSVHTESSAIEEKLALMSCKAAVKGNMKLSEEEAGCLLDELLELENPYMCPHGRPTIITMSQYELEKKFKRVVS